MRYIDADEIDYTVTMVCMGENAGYRAVAFESDIDAMPTADVVQRSEVENYKKVAEYQQKLAMDRYFEIKRLEEELATAKAEVAMEIFAEIEDVINNIGYFDEIDFRSIKKKYTEEKT